MSPHVHLPTVRHYKKFSSFYSLQITKHQTRTESPQRLSDWTTPCSAGITVDSGCVIAQLD